MKKTKKISNKNKILMIFVFLLLVAITLSTIFILLDYNEQTYYAVENQTTTKIGQYGKVLDTIERTLPQTSDGGLQNYPTYGTNIKGSTTTEQFNQILDENTKLIASSSTYDSMDEYGNLYLNGTPTGEKLYKHTSSANMYFGDVDDDEQAVVKEITISATRGGNYITGLYAPAGEVIKIEMTQEDLDKTGGVIVAIGQLSQNNEINNIWASASSFNRMPLIANKMNVSTQTAYVGFHLGGPIYITPNNTNCTFTIKISGAVLYMHYIHGLTTKEEFEQMKFCSAPYFDFEVWDMSVRHSGPILYAPKDYEKLYKVACLWENMSRVSQQVPHNARDDMGITFIYDPFIAAGAAVAFVDRNWCNLPPSWMSGSLDYESFITSGSWGTIHEFNHHYQSYGMESSTVNEVSNNSTTLLSYILYTNISSSRTLDDSTLTGWNRFTDPSRSLRETLLNSVNSNAQSSLNAYADIIHSFGVDKFIQATRKQNGKMGVDNWYTALCETMQYDFSYYFTNLLHQNISTSLIEKYSSLPTFVPVATIFQTGRNFITSNQEIFVETVRPYEINYGEPLVMNFNERLIVPNDFVFQIVEVTNPDYGTLTKTDENVYTYTPDQNSESGTFYVTISLSNDNITTPDITFSINIKQSGKTLIASKYTYSNKIYTTSDDALANQFEGYTTVNQYYSKNHFMNGLNNGSIGVIEGKIYIPTTDTYIICLRAGRGNHGLYISINNENNYEKVISLTGNNPNFTTNDNQTITLSLNAGDYVYFKEITVSNGNDAYMELGWSYGGSNVVSIPSTYILGTLGDYEARDFYIEPSYTKIYAIDHIYPEDLSAKVVSTEGNYGCWDNLDIYRIENVLNNDTSLQFHSKRNYNISETNPFAVTIDMGKIYTVNKFIITKYTGGNFAHMPTKFDLLGGTDADNLQLLGNYDIQDYTNGDVGVTFKDSNIRYYKLVVYKTNTNQYVAMKKIDMCYGFGGEEISPDTALFTSYEKLYTSSTFGHLISTNGSVKFSFYGSKFGFYTNQEQKCTLEIKIDGKSFEIEIDQLNKKYLAYLSDELSERNHAIIITVKSGILLIESLLKK